AASGGFDDEVGGKGLASALGVLEADCGNRGTVWRGHDFPGAAVFADGNAGVLLQALSYGELNQRAGHRIGHQPQIASRKRVVTGSFDAKVEADPKRHRAGIGKLNFKPGKEIPERILTPDEKRMRVPGLRGPRPVGSLRRENVALQHDDMLEV